MGGVWRGVDVGVDVGVKREKPNPKSNSIIINLRLGLKAPVGKGLFTLLRFSVFSALLVFSRFTPGFTGT